MAPYITRRAFLQAAAVGLAAGAPACDAGSRHTVDTSADAAIFIGAVVLSVPHPAGKIVGIALVVAGSIAKITIAAKDGSEHDDEIVLTDEQLKAIEEAIASGEHANVTQADGTKHKLKVRKK